MPDHRTGFVSAIPSTSNIRSEEHTSELQSQSNLVCRLLLEKKKCLSYPRALTFPHATDFPPAARCPRGTYATRAHPTKHPYHRAEALLLRFYPQQSWNYDD